MDKKTEELVVSFLEGELDEEGAQRLARHLETHDEDREEFLDLASQARAMEVLFAPARDLSVSVLNELYARKSGARFVGEVLARLPRPQHWWRRPIALAAAALVLLAVGVAIWQAVLIPTTPLALAAGWRIQPTGDAVYRVVGPDRVHLEHGEVLVESVALAAGEPPRPTLNIETPAGTAAATGTRFYIGAHTRSPQRKGSTAKRLTRVLVLAGVVGLSNPLGTVTGGPNDLLAAEPDTPPAKLAIQANSDFAFDLYAQLARENAGKNLFFSPYSISIALAMTAEGARGETAAQMGKVLRFPDAARRVGKDAQLIPWRTSLIHTGIAELNDRLTGRKDAPADQAARKKVAELRLANTLWGEKTHPFLDAYINTINKHYKIGGIFPADFKTNFPAERQRVNKWVEQQTNNFIKDIVPELPPDEGRLMRLILTNTICFKGEWSVPFKKANTMRREFTLADGKKIQTPMMNARNLEAGRYAAFNADGSFFETPARIQRGRQTGFYPGEDGFALLELPYKGDDLSMVLIAPNAANGLAGIEKKLTEADLTAWIAKGQKRKTHVLLPKFKLATDYRMKDTLQAMGMVRAFTDPLRPDGADFTGMCASKDPMTRPYITKVLHKTLVEVNEKGTEAAATLDADVMMAESRGASPATVLFTPTFKGDRPFLFLIRDVKTGSILFLGRMVSPAAK